MIRTVPRSRIKECIFMLLSGNCVSQEDVAVSLGGFNVLDLGIGSSGFVIHIAYLGRIDSRVVRHDHIPVAVVPDGVSWRACIRRSLAAPPRSGSDINKKGREKHNIALYRAIRGRVV